MRCRLRCGHPPGANRAPYRAPTHAHTRTCTRYPPPICRYLEAKVGRKRLLNTVAGGVMDVAEYAAQPGRSTSPDRRGGLAAV